MSEIKVGSVWTRKRRFEQVSNRLTVLAVDGDKVWVKWASGGRNTLELECLTSDFEIEEPFFEVGKTYKFTSGALGAHYYVTEIRKFAGRRFALAERTGGGPYMTDRIVSLDDFSEFTEV